MTASSAPPIGEVGFTTSGHSGQPVTWYRTDAQLRLEAGLVADLLIGEVDHIVNFAPTEHLYGKLYGEVLPELLDVPVDDLWLDPLAAPDLRPGARTLFVCLPSSWLVLRGLVDRLTELPAAVALHGTGPTTTVTDQVLRAAAHTPLRCVEIFGSTETGAVAFRNSRGESAWRLLPDVELVEHERGAEQALHVASPRLARRGGEAPPRSHVLSDVVRVVDERSFEFIGRRSRLIKVNGRRCDLDGVEARLRAGLPESEFVCVGVRDAAGGEHYELFHRGGDVAPVLPALLRGLPAPRAVHAVDRIPRTITGKVKVDRLFSRALAQRGGTA